MPRTHALRAIENGWLVCLVAPGRGRDRTIRHGMTEQEARAECRRLNRALNERDGPPDPRRGAFTYYYVRHGNHHTGANQ